MKKKAGWLSSVAVCALVAVTLPAGSASAHVKSFDSTVTLRVTDNYVYKGRVKSEQKDCYQHRAVTIYDEEGDQVLSGETDNRGRYRLTFIGEKYYAKVDKVTVGMGVHQHTCRADQSKTTKPPPRDIASSARAGGSGIPTTVTINDECPFECRGVGAKTARNYEAQFFGRVRSNAPKCERRRTVSLLRKGKPGEGFQRIARTKSDPDGDWRIIRDDKPGFTDYMVKVKEVRKAQLRCLGATSDKESHDPPG